MVCCWRKGIPSCLWERAKQWGNCPGKRLCRCC